MWNTIANFRENLSQMASEVLDTVEELEGSGTPRAEDGDLPTSSAQSPRSQASKGFDKQHRRPVDPFRRSRRVHHEAHEAHEGNGIASSESQQIERMSLDFGMREQELLNQMQSKELAYRALDESYRNALHEVEKLKLQLDKAELDLAVSNAQLSKSLLEEHEGKESITEEPSEPIGKEVQDERESKMLKEIQTRDETISQMQETLSVLEKERIESQAERDQLKRTLDIRELELQQASSKPESNTSENVELEMLKGQAQQVDVLLEKLKSAEESFESELADLKMKLEAVTLEKDKAVNNLSRLKQHLLEKENVDSEKMDRDSEQIAALEAKAAASIARVLQLEQALSQTLATQADSSRRFNEDLEASKLEIQSLTSKVNSLYAALEAKDIEISNLQMALGQYYAESDAKERLQRELETAKQELRKLTTDLEASKRFIDVQEIQNKEALDKLQLEEQKWLDSQQKSQKMQEDMLRLRRALEESMIRLNRMSSDSDYSVDRRIVIKLLVTYFEKGHSREVLDLMARILGFSEDDKRRVGLAHQNAGKPGVVRSVFGLPGRVVGGILGGNSSEATPGVTNNQSFADLWVDFLLKESEERDRKGKAEAGMEEESHTSSSSSPSRVAQPNGFVHDDIFGADFSLPPSSSASSSLNAAGNGGGHRRVFSRP